MPNFLSDPPQWIYLLLGVFLVVTGAIAAQRQDRKSALLFFVVFAIALTVFLLDRFFDSPREKAVKTAQAMASAADAKNANEFVTHVADTFVYHGEGPAKTVKRDELKNSSFWSMLRQYNVRVAVWDFTRDDVKEIDDNTVEIGFMAKGEAEGKPFPLFIRATFKLQSDGKMKLSEFRTLHPSNRKEVLAIPNFP
jgi:hypothetical protein